MSKAHEVTTLHSQISGHRTNYFIEKYIVIAESTSKAVALIPLREGEEVLEAKELHSHKVIMENANAST